MTDFSFPEVQSGKNIAKLALWLKAQPIGLQLSTERIAFLVSLVFLNQHQLDGAFSEDDLIEAFIACDSALGGKALQQLTRANQAINDLVAQRLLIRFSESLALIEPIYRLTPLGLAISDHYLHTKKFSSVSLAVQLQQVAQKISEAVQGSLEAGALSQWHHRVFVPLRYLVAEIFDRIDQAQRVLDLQQLQTKQAIAALLNERWDQALQSCEKLLSDTSSVLEELKQTLHALGDDIQSGLMTIRQSVKQRQELAFIETLVDELQRKFDQILCWGQRTIELWARYDRRVHKFLRTAIAIDKDRHFSESLRQSILEFSQHPWQLNIVACPKLVECALDKFESHPVETLGALNPLLQANLQPSSDNLEALFAQWQGESERELDASLESFLAYALRECLPAERFKSAGPLIQWWMQRGYSEAERRGRLTPWRALFASELFVQAHPIDRFYEVL